MYTITLALAAAISGKPHLAVAAAASGVLIGWPFSVLATAPIVIHSLLTGGFVKTVLVGLVTCISILVSVFSQYICMCIYTVLHMYLHVGMFF